MAQEKLLGESVHDARAGDLEPSAKHQSWSAILPGVVEIRERAGDEIAADAGVVRLPATVVTLGYERRFGRMEEARLLGPGALIEVARILVKQRREDGAADDDIGEGAGVAWSAQMPESR